ncbi:MAG: LysR family transcriptional regulator [Treponema sp.]|jgi:lysyl-tRNA synthetase class 2|nr:LysR family transcriptional regulator [Treponema sp.]
MDLELLRERARIIRKLRAFFDRRNYLELDTPLLAPDLIPETCLEVFETAFLPPRGSGEKKETLWLIPSPEIWMKKIIARHGVNAYQICKCFRNTESRGRLHSPEFTMLEYYTVDADYRDSLALTEELFADLLDGPGAWLGESEAAALRPPFERIAVEDAFKRWGGFSLYQSAARGPAAMEAEARRLGLDPPPGLSVPALYDLIFIHAVEPSLPRDRPAVLIDYPAFVPCLAQNGTPLTRERWELYINGVELANCYSEERDPETIRRYFEVEGAEKEKTALVKHRIDGEYWKIFLPRRGEENGAGQNAGRSGGFPRCSGTALGVDRLIMVLTGRSRVDGVLPFPGSAETVYRLPGVPAPAYTRPDKKPTPDSAKGLP